MLVRLLLLGCYLFANLNVYSEEKSHFSNVQAYLNQSVDDDTVAGGAVLVWHRGTIIFQNGFGYADIATKTPFKIDTSVVVASISKPLIGTTLYRLADQGKINLSAPITMYLPEFSQCKLESGEAINRPPTVTELLTHTSGMRPDDEPRGRIWFQSWTSNKSLSFVVSKVASDIPFHAQPGTQFGYCGIGTDVAARIGEVTSEQPRNAMLLTYLCEPLGMSATYYKAADLVEQHHVVMPTRYHRDKETGKLVITKERTLPDADTYASSGGSIISQAPDLLRWLLMIRNKGKHEGAIYLKEETVADMLTKHTLGLNARGGLFVRAKDEQGNPTLFGHTGSSGTNVWYDVKQDTIGIMLTQTKSDDIAEFRKKLQKMITEAVNQIK